jgi:uncharacterized protein (TIGR00255 family)
MLRSMTGYGHAHGLVEGVEFSVEARSVNNRYLKPVIKTPEYWSAAEAEIETLLRKRVSRGTVMLTVRVKLPDEQAAHRVNTAALSSYLAQLKVLEVEANPTLRIDLGSLLSLPGVCEPPPLEDLCERTKDGLLELVEKALEDLDRMRSREGTALGKELKAHCKMLLKEAKTVEARSPVVVADYRDRLTARVRDLMGAGTAGVDPDVLAREVALFAERADVTEELARLQSHVEQFLAAAESPDPAGRKLDFIAQEMLREANTVASKANDAPIARAAVEMKTAIDRIKEQVQNVE